jgi:predicted transcriptional regulator
MHSHTNKKTTYSHRTRTTIRLENSLRDEVKRLAYERDTSMQQIISEALRRYVQEDARQHVVDLSEYRHAFGEDLGTVTRKEIYEE